MLKNKPYTNGSIVATASVAGIRSNAGGSDYSASKAAVVSLMQTASAATPSARASWRRA